MRLKIVMKEAGRGEVFLDDHKISGITNVKLEMGVDQLSVLELRMVVGDAEIDGAADCTSIEDRSRTYTFGTRETT
jgi:hypothetical protein